MDRSIQRLQTEIVKWSEKTFSGIPQKRLMGTINHLKKEVQELIESPYDRKEFADCFLLILESASRAGIPVDLLINDAWNKLEVNKNRKWGTPDENGVVEHV